MQINVYPEGGGVPNDDPTICDLRNGGCEHTCIVDSNDNLDRTCDCITGYELLKDGTSCSGVYWYLMIVTFCSFINNHYVISP